jgi:hypothetical protein
MWPLLIVFLAPLVHSNLAQLQGAVVSVTEQFSLERLMEAFVLALSLGVKRAAVTDPDAQAHQPRLRGRDPIAKVERQGGPLPLANRRGRSA